MIQNNFPAGCHFRGNVRGFSLIELMIAVALGLIVSIAIVAFMMSSFRSNGQFVQATRLTQELRNTMDLMTRDLRRAGYNQSALSSMGLGSASPFAPMDLQSDCVIYAYDRKNVAAGSAPGVLDVSNGEVRGLRRRLVSFEGVNVGVIEYAESENGTKPACDGDTADYTQFPPACNTNSHWCSLSDPSTLNITSLALTDNGSNIGTTLALRDIDIVLTGQLRGDTTVSRSVNTSVRVRSDCFDPATVANCNVSP